MRRAEADSGRVLVHSRRVSWYFVLDELRFGYLVPLLLLVPFRLLVGTVLCLTVVSRGLCVPQDSCPSICGHDDESARVCTECHC
jgi:hypothetical protein